MTAPRPRRVPRAKRAGPAANPARGEHSLTLAGKAYRLRPSFAASQAIEDELGQSLTALLGQANRCALGYADLGVIVAELIRAGADDEMDKMVSADRVAELIYEEGVAQVYAVLTLLLADAILGGRSASGEAKAPAATTATP